MCEPGILRASLMKFMQRLGQLSEIGYFSFIQRQEKEGWGKIQPAGYSRSGDRDCRSHSSRQRPGCGPKGARQRRPGRGRQGNPGRRNPGLESGKNIEQQEEAWIRGRPDPHDRRRAQRPDRG